MAKTRTAKIHKNNKKLEQILKMSKFKINMFL